MAKDHLVIQTNNVNFSYSKSEPIIKNLNLEVQQGSVYGFLGPNGAGKTTTIRLIMGLLKPVTGSIKLFNDEDKDLKSAYKRIGAMIEDPALYFHLTAKENLEINCIYRKVSKSKISEILELVGLADTKNKKVKQFSTGMKQRLGIGMALLSDPDLIILDEPTNGLDPKGMIEVRELISRLTEDKKKTVFLSSHILSEIEKVCTHVGIIQNGDLKFQGRVEELKSNKDKNVIVEFETNNSERTREILTGNQIQIIEQHNGSISVNLKTKNQIPKLIDEVRNTDIEIYQVKIKDENLEDLFLSLTEN